MSSILCETLAVAAVLTAVCPQANMIPISWDRVILYHLEETSIGVWQPVLSTS